ncbi:MAG: hypothetical protein ACU83V_04170 [Gammaproteobacteria bacterium]
MTEGLFVLTVIFVAYVVYQVMNDKKSGAKAAVSEAKPAPAAAPKPQPEVKKEAAPAPAPKPVSAAPTAAAPAAKTGLKNPETGEVTAAFTNYRFAKRWIKEALVAEGLLDKVYKNNELDADAEAKIKDAVAKFEAMPKYKP